MVWGLTLVFCGFGTVMLVGIAWLAWSTWSTWSTLAMPQLIWAQMLFVVPFALFELVLAAILFSAAFGLARRVDCGRRTLLTLCRLNVGCSVLVTVFGVVIGLFVAGPLALLVPLAMAPYVAFCAVPVRLFQSHTVQRQMTDNWQFGTEYQT